MKTNKKKNMKKLICLFAGILTLSCSKDDSNSENTNPTETGLKLVRINEDRLDVNFGTTTSFTYANGLVTKMEYSQNGTTFYDETTNFNYVDGKLKSLSFFHQIYAQGIDTYTYNGNLISSCYSTQYSTETTNNYGYNALNQMNSHKVYDKFNNLNYNTEYNYNTAGNILNLVVLPVPGFGSALINTSYEYDTYKNPLSLVYNENVLKINFEGKNNITKRTNASSTSTFEYLYNDKGYPTQRIEKIGGNPYIKTTYTYN